MEENMIVVKDVSRGFEVGGDQLFWALKHINMEIPRGHLTILRGRSGSGKTTLMNILSALDLPTEGTVFLGENELPTLSEKAVVIFWTGTVMFWWVTAPVMTWLSTTMF